MDGVDVLLEDRLLLVLLPLRPPPGMLGCYVAPSVKLQSRALEHFLEVKQDS